MKFNNLVSGYTDKKRKGKNNMKKRVGIIGFGEMGKRHGLEFREATSGGIEIAGVVEPDDLLYQRG